MYTLDRKKSVFERLPRLYGMAAFLIVLAHAQTPSQGYMLHGYATLPIRATTDGSMEGHGESSAPTSAKILPPPGASSPFRTSPDRLFRKRDFTLSIMTVLETCV